jgi:hypothetical protein
MCCAGAMHDVIPDAKLADDWGFTLAKERRIVTNV